MKLQIKINWNNLDRYRNIFLFLFFAVFLVGFLILEMSWMLKILMICLSVWAGYMFFKKKENDFLVIILYFLLFYDCYSLFFSFSWPLWLPMGLIIVFTAPIYYFFWSHSRVYAVLLTLIILEIFLGLLPWPTDPKGKAMILVGIFYLFSGFISSREQNELSLKKIAPYIIVSFMVILMVILTSQWYGY